MREVDTLSNAWSSGEGSAAPIRSTTRSRLAVTFAEREPGPAGGVLPARESRELRPVSLKQQHSRSDESERASGESDVALSERQPILLKDKGDNFARNSDRKSAIAAYSEAILILSDGCPSMDSPSSAAGPSS